MNESADFAIHTSDTNSSKKFYENVFDWKCSSYAGTEEFAKISSPNGSVIGALSARRYNPDSKDIFGLECSIIVSEVDETTEVVEAAGGRTLMPKTAIPHSGRGGQFAGATVFYSSEPRNRHL